MFIYVNYVMYSSLPLFRENRTVPPHFGTWGAKFLSLFAYYGACAQGHSSLPNNYNTHTYIHKYKHTNTLYIYYFSIYTHVRFVEISVELQIIANLI